MGKKNFQSIQLYIESVGVCVCVCENFLFVEVIYEYVIVARLKRICQW